MLYDSTDMLHEIQLIQGQPEVASYRPPPSLRVAERRTIAIAPATERNYVGHNQTSELMRCRKKINFKTNPYTGPQAVSIARRNARERNRVKQVNDGFAALRRHLPASVVAALSHGARRGAGKKLSKVDTLRMVVEYIRYLQQLLDESDAAAGVIREVENNENICASPVSELSRVDDQFVYSGSPCGSPAPSESSSGVSSGSGYSLQYSTLERYDTPAPAHVQHQQLSPMEEDELLDVISWWQQK